MKAIYVKPEMNIVYIQQTNCLMDTSGVTVGNDDYQDGNPVLSRGGSWDDDDDEY